MKYHFNRFWSRSTLAVLAYFLSLTIQASPALPNAKPYTMTDNFLAGAYIGAPGGGWDSIVLDAHLRWLSNMGIKLIHTSSNEVSCTFGQDCEGLTVAGLADRYGMQVIWQLGGSYLANPHDVPDTLSCDLQQDADDPDYFSCDNLSSICNKVCSAKNQIIKAEFEHKNILAYAVREEPDAEDMCRVLRYQQEILSGISVSRPFFVLQNQRDAAEEARKIILGEKTCEGFIPEEYPLLDYSGSDRYFFTSINRSINTNSGTVQERRLYTPTFAMKQLNAQGVGTNGFWNTKKHALVADDERAADQGFFGVITGNAQVSYKLLDQLDDSTRALALEGNLGWSVDPDNNERALYFTYYRPPENAMRAQTWSAIANGSHAVMLWTIKPDDGQVCSDDPTEETDGWCFQDGTPFVISTSSGREGKGSVVLDEFTDTVDDIAVHGWLINRLTPISIFDTPENAQYQTFFDNIRSRHDPFYCEETTRQHCASIPVLKRLSGVNGLENGKVLTLVNTHMGTWDGGAGDRFVDAVSNFHLDSEGRVKNEDYLPASDNVLVLDVSSLPANEQLYDIATGQSIDTCVQDLDYPQKDDCLNNANKVSIQLLAGQGAFLFLGQPQELDQIRKLAGLSGRVDINGRFAGDEEKLKHKRIVFLLIPLLMSAIMFCQFLFNLISLKRVDITVFTHESNLMMEPRLMRECMAPIRLV